MPSKHRDMTARLASALALAIAVAACTSPAVPSAVVTAWTMAQIEQPTSVTAAPPTFAVHCSPCHPDATLGFAMALAPFGLLAFGIQEPPPHAAAWRSQTGASWTWIGDFPSPPGSIVLAATYAAGRLVAVGADSAGARSWASAHGTAWSISAPSAATAGPDASTRMTAIVPWAGGFLAAGYADVPAKNRTSAAFWSSTDGLSWTRLPDDPAFAGGHVLALAVSATRLVAVGPTGSQTAGGSAAWTSTDGRTWTRAIAPDLARGVMHGVAATDTGFVAVGLDAADDHVMAWTSPDGLSWTAHDGGEPFANGGQPIRAAAVIPYGSVVVAVGWKSDAGNGSGVVWRSTDGMAWVRDPAVPAFSGGEIASITGNGDGLVAVGTTGYPDNDQATMWLGPGGR